MVKAAVKGRAAFAKVCDSLGTSLTKSELVGYLSGDARRIKGLMNIFYYVNVTQQLNSNFDMCSPEFTSLFLHCKMQGS